MSISEKLKKEGVERSLVRLTGQDGSSVASHAASHEVGGADLVDHDDLTNFTVTEHFTEASIDHENILNAGTSNHVPDGGNNLDHLQTDGAGTLSWIAPVAASSGFTYSKAHASNPVWSGTFTAAGNNANTWYDLDLSDVIGSNRAIVLLRYTISAAGGGGTFQAKGKGDDGNYGDWINRGGCSSFGGGLQLNSVSQILVVTDSSGFVSHAVSNINQDFDIDVICYIK